LHSIHVYNTEHQPACDILVAQLYLQTYYATGKLSNHKVSYEQSAQAFSSQVHWKYDQMQHFCKNDRRKICQLLTMLHHWFTFSTFTLSADRKKNSPVKKHVPLICKGSLSKQVDE